MRKKIRDLSPPDEMAELGCVPMTPEALSKMSLNPYDQLFICRLMSMRDEAAKDEVYQAVAEVVANLTRKMLDSIDQQTKLMKAMSTDIADIKTRLTEDEGKLRTVIQRLDDKKKRLDGLESEVKDMKKRLGTVERTIKTFKK
jgi:DNA repair exonuclease SbcCD ATPase subunit